MTRGPWWALALLALIVFVRSAGFAFGVLNIDEADLLVFGASLLRGEIPYRDLAELKPPLGYVTWLLSAFPGDFSIGTMRVVAVAWVFGTALALGRVHRLAPWLFVLATQCELPSFNLETQMNLPIALALVFFARDRDLLAGAFVGLASLYKHQAAAAGLALGLAVLLRDRSARRALLLLAGFLVPWLACAAAFHALGALPDFVDWVFVRNLHYAGGATDGALARFVQSTLVCVGATILPWTLALSRPARPGPVEGPTLTLALRLSLALTALAVAAGGRFYEHYYLQFAPFLALLAAPAAASFLERWSTHARPLRALAIAAAVLPLLGLTGYSWARGLAGGYPSQDARTHEVAAWLRGHARPGDRLFVWGHWTPLHVESRLLAGARFANASPLMGNFDPLQLPAGFDAAAARNAADEALLAADLERRKPRFLVDTAPCDLHGWSRVPLAKFPVLARLVERSYARVADPAGCAVWERK